MQKFLSLLAAVLLVAVLSIGFSSCKDDENEPAKVTLQFSSSAKTVGEGEQGVKANIVLSGPAPADFILEYELSGSATRKIGSNAGDYEVVGGSVGEINIAKGETSAEIEFNILEDALLETDEKIVVALIDATISQVEIGNDDQMEVTIAAGGSVQASFATTAATVNESDEGLHEITVQLASAAAFDVTVQYDITPFRNAQGQFVAGVAIDSLGGDAIGLDPYYYDYRVEETSGQITIPAGQTSGVIKVNVYSDFLLESDEKIELTLKETTGVTLGTNTKFTMTIKQEDGSAVELTWANNISVDMDLFLWLIVDTPEMQDSINIALSAFDNTGGRELSMIPKVFSEAIMDELNVTSLTYGVSYVYYSGTSDALNFKGTLANFVNGTASIISEKTATYKLINQNKWDTQTGTDPLIVQTFVYSAGGIGDVSAITVPSERSRSRDASAEITKRIERIRGLPGLRSISK